MIMAKRGDKPPVEVSNEVETGDNKANPELEEVAKDILRAIDERSPIVLAHALQAAFEICDSMPHEEGEHMDEEEAE